MIVNCRDLPYSIVELDAEDMKNLNKGKDVIGESRSANDKSILVRVYCSNPKYSEDDHD